MQCVAWWAFEIMILLAGFISVDAIATQIIMLNTAFLIFMFPLGIQIAAATLVG